MYLFDKIFVMRVSWNIFVWNQFSSICFKFQNFIPRIFSQVSREKVFRTLFILTNQNYHYKDIFRTLQISLTLLGICSENKYHEIFYNSVLMYLAQWHVFDKQQHTKNLMSCKICKNAAVKIPLNLRNFGHVGIPKALSVKCNENNYYNEFKI